MTLILQNKLNIYSGINAVTAKERVVEELHAAKSEEVASLGEESRGRVLRQQPEPAQPVDKANTTVSLWIDLGNIPVSEIDGIGDKLGEKLSKR